MGCVQRMCGWETARPRSRRCKG